MSKQKILEMTKQEILEIIKNELRIEIIHDYVYDYYEKTIYVKINLILGEETISTDGFSIPKDN